MTINVLVKSKLKVPRFNFQGDLLEVAKKVVVPSMAEGIDKRTDIDGKSFPKLAPSTIRIKGHDRPLVRTGELRRSFIFKKRGKTTVLITLKNTRKFIGEVLQVMGVRSKAKGLKFFKFFGISKKAEKLSIGFMQNKIEGIIRRAR